MTARYGAHVFWLETSVHRPRPPLQGHVDVDVAVVGGGFTGLWTAWHLLEREPSLRLVVLEREEIGFGASGRNGGFAMTLLDMSLAHLRRNHGDDDARAAHRAVARSVHEIVATVAAEGIDCELRHGGLLVAATNAAQLRRVEADLDAARELGLEGFTALDARQVQARVRSPRFVGGLYEAHCAVVHPAKLVRGLADAVERRGAAVHEDSGILRLTERGDRLRLATPTGTVVADQVVLATNAWAASTPWFAEKVVPLFTHVVLTEPLTDAQWDAVGWEGHEGLEDKRNFVHYSRRTADGRILWGGADGIVHRRSARIRRTQDRSAAAAERLRRSFRATFPQLADVRFTHTWGGPVGITASFLPLFGTLLDGRLHYGLGYNGHGVAPSHTGGRILRDKVLGRTTPDTRLRFVDAPETRFPPEPLRWIGAALTRAALHRQDRRADAGRLTGDMDPLLLRVLDR